jgi:hypothetical protein
MGLQERQQGKISDDVAVVTKDGLVFIQEILNVLQSPRRIQKYWFMAKGDGYTSPSPVRKFLRINFRAMMRVYDEAIHADFQEMIHNVSDDRTPSDLKERLRKSLRQRPKPRPQSGRQDEGCLESSSFQCCFSVKDDFS